VLSLIGGIIIFLVGLLIYAAASILSALLATTPGSDQVPGLVGVPMTIAAMGLVGILTGLLVIVFGVLMYIRPQQHVIWGALVLVLSLVSILGFGGFFLGLILGLIGGVRADDGASHGAPDATAVSRDSDTVVNHAGTGGPSPPTSFPLLQ